MFLLATEEPFVAVVSEKHLHDTCSNCFAKPMNLIVCDKCGIMSYCDGECLEEDKFLHEVECSLINERDSPPSDEIRILLRLIRRTGRDQDFVAFNDRKLTDLYSHVTAFKQLYKQDSSIEKTIAIALKVLKADLKSLGESSSPSQTVITNYARCKKNVIDIIDDSNVFRPEKLGIGLYIGLSAHPKACDSKCFITFTGKIAAFRSENEPDYSKKLPLPNNVYNLPYYSRIETNPKCSNSECSRCRNFSPQLGMSDVSGKCYFCKVGYVLPLPSNDGPTCNSCWKVAAYTLDELNAANDQARDYLFGKADEIKSPEEESEDEDPLNTLICLYNKMEKILSPENLYFYHLAKLLETVYLNSGDDAKLWKYVLAQKKSVEKYFPYNELALYYLKISDLTRPTYIEYEDENAFTVSRISWMEAISSAEIACKMSHDAFGKNHPLTVDVRYKLECYQFYYEQSTINTWDYHQRKLYKRNSR